MKFNTQLGKRVLGAIALVVLLALVVPFVVYGVPQLIGADASFTVVSGSMQPSIDPGDAVIVEETRPANIGPGDVITFTREGSAQPITHRVVSITEDGNGQRAFVTKGDNNEEADQQSVARTQLVGRVVLTIPYIGHVVLFANTQYGFVLFVAVPVVLLLLNEGWTIFRRTPTDPEATAAAAAAAATANSGITLADPEEGAEGDGASDGEGAASAGATADNDALVADADDDVSTADADDDVSTADADDDVSTADADATESGEEVVAGVAPDASPALALSKRDLSVTMLVLGAVAIYAAVVVWQLRAAWTVTALVAALGTLLFVAAIRRGLPDETVAVDGDGALALVPTNRIVRGSLPASMRSYSRSTVDSLEELVLMARETDGWIVTNGTTCALPVDETLYVCPVPKGTGEDDDTADEERLDEWTTKTTDNDDRGGEPSVVADGGER